MKRKRGINFLLWACAILLVSCLSYEVYQVAGYLRGVEADVMHKLTLVKTFFVKYHFSRKVLSRSFCENENNLSYFVLIKLDSSIELPPFPYDSYYREYDFDVRNGTVKIRVTRKVYEKANKNAIVIKPADSDSIFIDSKCYLLLGKEEQKWLPD